MNIRGLARGGRKRAVVASAGATLMVLAGAALAGAAGAASGAPAASAAVTLGPAPLGADVAPWDPAFSSNATFNRVAPLLTAAGINQFHYGGGVTADVYNWKTNTDIQGCAPNTAFAEFADPACDNTDGVPFSLFSQKARSLGGQSFVTVNYGSGTPALAADWVTESAKAGEGVTDWEIGNESYGCWEVNNPLAGLPESYQGYVAGDSSTCPDVTLGNTQGMQTLATSYAVNAGKFITAMRKVDPNAQIGVPWAFGNTVGGASVNDNTTWNNTVLSKNGPDINFVDAHWYPYGFGGATDPTGLKKPSDYTVIQSVKTIPGLYAQIQAELNTYAPGAGVIVGETGVSFLPTDVPCTPAGALFAAGDVLEWLAAGAQSVDWWPLDNADNTTDQCVNPQEAMFTSTGAPTSAYYGYLLASKLAQPGAQLSTLTASVPSNPNAANDILAFQSVLPGGKVAVALINSSTTSSRKVTFGSALSGYLATQTYGPDASSALGKMTTGTTTTAAIAGGITLSPETVVVLTERTLKPSTVSLTGSATVKAGTKVTLNGSLTLNGAGAPAGVPVNVIRQLNGKTQATLTAKTVAGGGFTVTDLPQAAGSYTYQASYISNTYLPATASFAVKVATAKPALKLALSATTVKVGQKITVTATLGAPHVNKTLIIYATPKGGVKKVIKHATVNAKGQISVVYPVKANTTFTLVFTGDSWYTSGTVTAVVKA